MSERQKRIRRVEPQRCPRRDENPMADQSFPGPDWWETGQWAATQKEADAEVAEFMAAHPNGGIGNVLWCYGGEQPRTCSYCGGVHPDDAVTLIQLGWNVDPTDKRYKRYLEPPTYRPFPSPIPPVKLYLQHCSQEQIDSLNAALRSRSR